MKTHLLIFSLLVISINTFAQNDTIKRFYDHEDKPSVDQPYYYTVAYSTDSIWTRYNFYADLAKPAFVAYYLDRDFKRPVGLFTSYHRNGKVKSRGNYYNEKKAGTWLSWNEKGDLSDSTVYLEGAIHYKKGFNNDRSISEIIETHAGGEARMKGFFRDGSLHFEGAFEDGKRNGEWTFYFDGGKQVVSYLADSVLNFYCYDTQGKKIEDCIYEDASIAYSTDPILNEVAVKVISKAPDWSPAIQYNRKVKSYQFQPVTILANK